MLNTTDMYSMERTGDLWDTGAIDITGSLMVIFLKQVSIAHNISDGHSPRAASLSEERRSLLISSPPSLLQYLSFMYAFGNLLSGPFNEFADYVTFTHRAGAWKGAFAPGMAGSAFTTAAKCVSQALALLIVNLFLGAFFSPKLLTAPRVWDLSMGQRYLIAMITGVTQASATKSAYYLSLNKKENATSCSHQREYHGSRNDSTCHLENIALDLADAIQVIFADIHGAHAVDVQFCLPVKCICCSRNTIMDCAPAGCLQSITLPPLQRLALQHMCLLVVFHNKCMLRKMNTLHWPGFAQHNDVILEHWGDSAPSALGILPKACYWSNPVSSTMPYCCDFTKWLQTQTSAMHCLAYHDDERSNHVDQNRLVASL